jgi:hypothetical protein
MAEAAAAAGAAQGAAAAAAAAAMGAQMAAAMGGTGGPGGRRPSRRTSRGGGGSGGGDSGVTPLYSNESRLVLRFTGETTTISKVFVEEQVIGRLRGLQFGEDLPDARSAFHEVSMFDEVDDIWRDRRSFRAVRADPTNESAQRYLGFEGYAIVNLGEDSSGMESDESGAAARGSRRRRSR